MAKAAAEELGARIRGGAIIKYRHSHGPIPGIGMGPGTLSDIETLRSREDTGITGNELDKQFFSWSQEEDPHSSKNLPGLSLQSLTDITSALLMEEQSTNSIP